MAIARPAGGASLSPLLTPVVTGLVVGVAFVAVYVGLQRQPSPRGLPVAAVGGRLAAVVGMTAGPAAAVETVRTRADGDALLRRGDVAAVLTAAPSGVLVVEYAGARGSSETGAAMSIGQRVARTSGLRTSTADVVPLTADDSRGLSSFYVVFGVTLSSFVVAQGLAAAARTIGQARRFVAIGGFAVAIGLIAAGIAGPGMHALPAPFAQLALTLILLSAASAAAVSAFAAWLGRFANGISVLILTVVGNATSGASIGYHLLPGWAQACSSVLPAGAAFRAVTDFGYFDAEGAPSALTVLAIWAAAGLVLVVAHHRRATYAAKHDRFSTDLHQR